MMKKSRKSHKFQFHYGVHANRTNDAVELVIDAVQIQKVARRKMHCCEVIIAFVGQQPASRTRMHTIGQIISSSISVRRMPTTDALSSALSSQQCCKLFDVCLQLFCWCEMNERKKDFAAIESSHFSSAQVSQFGSILSSLSAFAAIAREYKSKALQCSARLRQALCRHRIYAQCLAAFSVFWCFWALQHFHRAHWHSSLMFGLLALSSPARMCWVARAWVISWVFNVETTITFGRERERRRIL